MNRIFHARIAMGQYLFLILIGILAVYMLWYKSPFLAAILHALAGGYYREADSYHLYRNARREVGAVLRRSPGVRNSDERHHFCGACFFHAGRAVCGDALCAREIWRG